MLVEGIWASYVVTILEKSPLDSVDLCKMIIKVEVVPLLLVILHVLFSDGLIVSQLFIEGLQLGVLFAELSLSLL